MYTMQHAPRIHGEERVQPKQTYNINFHGGNIMVSWKYLDIFMKSTEYIKCHLFGHPKYLVTFLRHNTYLNELNPTEINDNNRLQCGNRPTPIMK